MNYNLSALILAALIAFNLSVADVKCKRSRIVGGRNVTENEIKYIVSIRCGKIFCGGGIIDDKLIITAAHCIKLNQTTGTLLKPMRILAATNTQMKYDRTKTIVIGVARAFLPAVHNQMPMDDIAILELKKSLELEKNKDKLQKLRLPIPNESESDNSYPTYERYKLKFAGYGRSHVDTKTDENGTIHYYPKSGGRLKVANATVIGNRRCSNVWKYKISDKCICISITEDETKKTRQGTCRGDSGSPAVINNNIIIGISSIGTLRCNNNFRPSIFTRVTSYIEFIQNIMDGDMSKAVIYSS